MLFNVIELNNSIVLAVGLNFIKGDAVTVPPPGQPAVLEFWASWCGPCRAAFPHLSDIARKYKDRGLVVIGINIEGDSPAVRKLVVDQGTKMDYRVAIDAAQQASNKLMGAAGVSGIPVAFIVDAKGIIRHCGHPMDPKFGQMVASVCNEAKAAAAAAPKPVTQTKEELAAMPVKDLKAILNSWKVSFADLNEKSELVERILERCRK
jgi:thiol-disulfide isomerase/thioredoxin